MSTGRSNAMDALPRGSFLTYFTSPARSNRRASRYRQRPPPPYSKHSSKIPLLSPIPEDSLPNEISDEEARLGFWGEHHPDDDDDDDELDKDHREKESGISAANVLSLLGYTLLILLIVLNVDFLLSTYNKGSGLVDWDTFSTRSDYEMHFCLADENREAPIPRVWRYVAANTPEHCTTSTLKMYAVASEEWKLLSEDSIVVGHEPGPRHDRVKDARDDDPAEEGYVKLEHIPID